MGKLGYFFGMHVFMYVWTMCAYGGQRTNLGIVSQMPSTFYLRQGLSPAYNFHIAID